MAQAKSFKVLLARNIVALCGDVVDHTIVSIDTSKIQSILHTAVFTATTELRSFLGHASFHCQFVNNFAYISVPPQTETSRNCDIQ